MNVEAVWLNVLSSANFALFVPFGTILDRTEIWHLHFAISKIETNAGDTAFEGTGFANR